MTAVQNGTIVRIARCSFTDGPGLRSVVIFKGCPLRCLWCSTPESQSPSPELVYDKTRCTRCGKCVAACPRQAIRISSQGGVVTLSGVCQGCGVCTAICINKARVMVGVTMTVAQVMEEVEKDIIFLRNSGGGVTLSGGEPMLQADFAAALLATSRQRGIHTAIETCGHARWAALDQVLRHVDFVYLDIKHIDPDEHRRLTGQGNELILSNARRIAKDFPEISVMIRVPVVPGFNDSEQNIVSIADFSAKMANVAHVELLPYHRLGIHQYAGLARPYSLTDVRPPDAELMHRLACLVESLGVPVQIGE